MAKQMPMPHIHVEIVRCPNDYTISLRVRMWMYDAGLSLKNSVSW